MGWQLAIVIVLVTLSGIYVGWRNWREWSDAKKGGCGGGCGCAVKPQAKADEPILIEQLTVRKR